MNYSVIAKSIHKDEGIIVSGDNKIPFGISKQNNLMTPADILVSAFAACCLKNVERFSELMHYSYESADISVVAVRKDKPPMIERISFSIIIQSKDDKINTDLLLRNLQKFGTIYNTLDSVCDIDGDISFQKI